MDQSSGSARFVERAIPRRFTDLTSAQSLTPVPDERIAGHDHETIRPRVSDELTVGGIGQTGDVGISVVGVLWKGAQLERIFHSKEANNSAGGIVAAAGGNHLSIRLEGPRIDGLIAGRNGFEENAI